MATTAVATRVNGPKVSGGSYKGKFTLVLDTTTAAGIMTLDLTDWFHFVDGISFVGDTADTGYVFKAQTPGAAVAITATNVEIAVYEAAADGGPLDSVDSTDVSGVAFATALTIEVSGTLARTTSWA